MQKDRSGDHGLISGLHTDPFTLSFSNPCQQKVSSLPFIKLQRNAYFQETEDIYNLGNAYTHGTCMYPFLSVSFSLSWDHLWPSTSLHFFAASSLYHFSLHPTPSSLLWELRSSSFAFSCLDNILPSNQFLPLSIPIQLPKLSVWWNHTLPFYWLPLICVIKALWNTLSVLSSVLRCHVFSYLSCTSLLCQQPWIYATLTGTFWSKCCLSILFCNSLV